MKRICLLFALAVLLAVAVTACSRKKPQPVEQTTTFTAGPVQCSIPVSWLREEIPADISRNVTSIEGIFRDPATGLIFSVTTQEKKEPLFNTSSLVSQIVANLEAHNQYKVDTVPYDTPTARLIAVRGISEKSALLKLIGISFKKVWYILDFIMPAATLQESRTAAEKLVATLKFTTTND